MGDGISAFITDHLGHVLCFLVPTLIGGVSLAQGVFVEVSTVRLVGHFGVLSLSVALSAGLEDVVV